MLRTMLSGKDIEIIIKNHHLSELSIYEGSYSFKIL